jgi:hypothetical protein
MSSGIGIARTPTGVATARTTASATSTCMTRLIMKKSYCRSVRGFKMRGMNPTLPGLAGWKSGDC